MKKSFKIIGVCVGILLSVIIVITVFLYRQINKPYTKIIDMNWSIKLPSSCKEIYYIDSGASKDILFFNIQKKTKLTNL